MTDLLHRVGITRRQLLGAGAAGVASLGLPRRARAASGEKKFLFVFNGGGWDPTRVFADGLDHRQVDMESGVERATAGGLTYLDHGDRPSVKTFFDRYHDRSVILNGVMVRSIAHEICTMLAMTGTTSGLVPDWPAILGAHSASAPTLPHLVLGGPSFPGDLGEAVVRAGASGQLDALLNGGILDWSDTALSGLSAPSQGILDNYLRRRAAARVLSAGTAQERALAEAFAAGTEKATDLKDLRYVMNFSGGSDLASMGAVALDALSIGLSRAVTICYPTDFGGEWDTHATNDELQSPLWEGLFKGLLAIFDTMESLPGADGGTLADETVVVVLSEMGRTPQLNPLSGKDHWPYTSVLMAGPGLDGSRVIGGFDESWYGRTVDPATGELDDGGQILSSEAVGATLLALGDVDPDGYVSGVEPISGILT